MGPSAEWSKIINGKKCLNTATICEIFNITHSALSKWAANGCPKEATNWWSVEEVLRWRGLVGAKAEEQLERLSYQEQKLKAEAELKATTAAKEAIRLGELRGEYVLVEDVKKDLQAVFMAVRRSMMALGRVAGMEAAAFTDAATARRIEQAVREVVADGLEQFAATGEYVPPKRRRRKPGRPRKSGVA